MSHLFCNVLIIKEIFTWVYTLLYLCICTAKYMHMLHISEHVTPRHATPRHDTTRHDTPRHARHATHATPRTPRTPRHARHATTLFVNVPRGTCMTSCDSCMLGAACLHTHICQACLICKVPRMLNGQGGAIWTAKFSYPPLHILATQKFFCFLRKYHDNLYFWLARHAQRAVSSLSNLSATVSAKPFSPLDENGFLCLVFIVQSVSYSISVLYIYCAVSNIFVQRAMILMFNLLATVSVSCCLTQCAAVSVSDMPAALSMSLTSAKCVVSLLSVKSSAV